MNELDTTSPVPLYHQIANTIRLAIESGELEPGDRLTPLRVAAKRWGVHHHTVRHAYVELARENLIESSGPRGTRVAARVERRAPKVTAATDIDEFVNRFIREARNTYGLSAVELTEQIARRELMSGRCQPEVYIVECSLAQATDLADQLMDAWDVLARPLCLDEIESLPDGHVVGTYFHYNAFRTRWPRRLSDTHFVSIHPDRQIAKRLERYEQIGRPVACILYEYDVPTADAIAADLSTVLDPEKYIVETRVISQHDDLSMQDGALPTLFPPRVWANLPEAAKQSDMAVEIRYIFDGPEVDALGRALGWTRDTRWEAMNNGAK